MALTRMGDDERGDPLGDRVAKNLRQESAHASARGLRPAGQGAEAAEGSAFQTLRPVKHTTPSTRTFQSVQLEADGALMKQAKDHVSESDASSFEGRALPTEDPVVARSLYHNKPLRKRQQIDHAELTQRESPESPSPKAARKAVRIPAEYEVDAEIDLQEEREREAAEEAEWDAEFERGLADGSIVDYGGGTDTEQATPMPWESWGIDTTEEVS